MSKKRTVYNALPIVAAAYGEKFGVKVALGSDTASTDGQTIVIPNVPDDYPNMDAVWGYLAHEAAHVRFTDFNVERRRGLHAHLTNVIEDCRIERAMPGVYPGTALTLHEMARYMLQAGHYEPVRDEDHPASILSAYCLYWLQTVGVGQTALQERLDGAKAVFERVFPQGVVVRLNALLRKCVDAKSTANAASLADDIIKMIEEEKDSEEQQNPKSQREQSPEQKDKSSDDSQSPNGQEQSSSNGNDEKSQEQQGGSSGAQSEQNENSPEVQGNNSEENASGNSSPPNASQLLQQVLSAGNSDLPKNAQDALKQDLNLVAQQEGDDRYQTVRSAMDIHDHKEAGQRLNGDVKSTTSKIRQQLYGLVQASQRTAHRNQRSGKRVDTRQLHKVVIGDTRIFQRPEAKKRPNTAVHILVDMSSSMDSPAGNGKRREDIAREASLAIALALESIPGVNPAVTFFGNNSNVPVYSVVKHGQKVQNQTGKFVFNSRGGTPMAEGIWYSAFELTKTREERKMMIVVTDGAPNNALACHKAIGLCEASDIEMIGIGIETTAVNRLFNTNIVIEDAADLQKTLFKLMERSLTAFAA
ncbi:VWA domain-containing protein (plasmid) [Photobacterium leiognathi subsp. mandapamensis]|uniref:VWA domain-containing protein n=1 Tax=Photobacterium leiognathi TaxID=553611 RepID=UPI003AF38328